MNLSTFWGGAAAPYQIEQSLRFDGSSRLTRTPSSNGNGQTFTWSAWIKKGKNNHNTSGADGLLGAGTNSFSLNFQPNNDGLYFVQNSGARPQEHSVSKFRDPTAWMHIIFVADTTNATAADRTRVYINGERFTNWNAANTNHANQNQTLQVNQTSEQQIGCHRNNNGITYEFYGYMAEVVMLDGTAVTDGSSFGEYDSSGVWRPIEISGLTFGTNGYYLKFDPSATNGIGHDHSGNGNNWTASGFTASDTTNPRYQDVVYDTPTNNFATFSPLYNYESTYGIFEGNLKTDTNSGSNVQNSTIGVTSGKFYAEYYCEVSNSVPFKLGIQDLDGDQPSHPEQNTWTLMFQGSGNNYIFQNGSWTNPGSGSLSWNNGDYVGLALDADARTCRLYVNGSLSCTINFSSYFGAGERTLAFMHCYAAGSGAAVTWINFGQQPWKYSPPSGYKALCTANLPAPDIADGSEYFETVLYTGNGSSTQQIATSFEPDFVWNKIRNAGYYHRAFDRLRGTLDKALYTSANYSEDYVTDYGEITATSSTSVTIGQGGDSGNLINANGNTGVLWNWKAGGSGSSNTSGSITSTVSANPSAGFSIVTYSGAGGNASIGHGLGVAPQMIIVKRRNASATWLVWHQDLPSIGRYLILNTTEAVQDGGGAGFGGSSYVVPSSTTFTVGSSNSLNNSSGTYVAYCFAEVEGYSKFGSYTGNGSLDGPFVYCGFRPAWVMIKRTDGTGEWFMVDTARNTYNAADQDLFANFSYAETASSGKDLLSNGFKIRESGASMNASGGTFIFMAFSENPFGGDGVSPATAR